MIRGVPTRLYRSVGVSAQLARALLDPSFSTRALLLTVSQRDSKGERDATLRVAFPDPTDRPASVSHETWLEAVTIADVFKGGKP